MRYQKLKQTVVLVGITFVIFLCFLQNIYAETYQSGKITVKLEELSVRKDGRSIQFDHPHVLVGNVLTNILSYTYFEEKGLLKKKEALRVFQDDEIRRLVPLIVQAFSVAKPTQVVLVSSYSERVLLADKQNYFILFISDDRLHMVFSRIRAFQTYNDNMSAKKIYTQTRENPSTMKRSRFWQLIPSAGQQLKPKHENWLIVDLYQEAYQQPIARRVGTVDEKIKMETSDLDTRLKKLEEMMSSGIDGVSDQSERVSLPGTTRAIHQESELKAKLIILYEMVNEGLLSKDDYDYKKIKLLEEAMADMSIRDQLRELKELKSEGLITEGDYNEKKKDLLDQF